MYECMTVQLADASASGRILVILGIQGFIQQKYMSLKYDCWTSRNLDSSNGSDTRNAYGL
jgi:hypothetical protein